MLLHPTSVRNKDLITQWPLSYNNIANLDLVSHYLQDGQLPPDLLPSHSHPLPPSHPGYQLAFHQEHQQQLPHLDSPFQSPHIEFLPSPAFSSRHSPATTNNYYSPVFDGSLPDAPSMSVASSYNPSFHHTAPSPSPHPNVYQQQQFYPPMLAQPGITPNTHSWDTADAANAQLLSPAHAQRSGFQHKRAASGSSGKTGSSSPQAGAAHNQYQNPKKSLPTPVQTPVQNSFLAPAFQNYDPSTQNGDAVVADQAMRQAVMEQNSSSSSNNKPHQADDDTSFHYSLAPSVSSLSHQNSPVTPQATYDEFDDGSKIVHDFNSQGAMSIGLPKFNRTISDLYQDELYNTAIVPTSSTMRKNPNPTTNANANANANANTNQQLLNAPYRNLFADRLNAATQGHLSARSQSPVGNSINRDRSPFRQGSPLAADFRHPNVHLQSGLGSALQLENHGEVKTISPKDALLEFHEGPDDAANLPSLFPANDISLTGASNMTSRRQSATSAFQPTLPYNQMEAFPSQYATQASAGLQQPLNSFIQQQQQQQQQFPASLPTMESTTSDNATPRRPDDTSSDSGTYTCTYHGCTLRFETPAKLQKHKREAHRQTITGQTTTSSETANTSLALRNSQAGPHKCERINPSTGKPCNSIFSRPYDLTRHEDTIHNARKQKVRCHLCTEEKTFSRNDALTRHMRVVHPEVDWPGKQRRKGRD